MLVVGGIGAPRIQSASHGAPGGHGGRGIVAATAIHRSLKPVRKKGRPSQAHDANDADEDDSKIIHHSCTWMIP